MAEPVMDGEGGTMAAAGAVAAPARQAAGITRTSARRKRVSPFTWLVYVYLVIMCVFSLFPMFYVVQASLAGAQNLYTTNLQLLPAHPTLGNYGYVFTQIPLPSWIGNTLLVTGASTLMGLAFATAGGYALARFRFRGRQMTLVVLLALQAFPSLLALFAYFILLQTLGLINTLPGLTLVYAAGTLTLGAWNMKGYFDTIPAELEQAAWVDGATPVQAFLRVALPLAAPALAATALLMFTGMWSEFAIGNIVLNSNANGSNLTFALGINSLGSEYRVPWGYFAAASVAVAFPLMAVFLYGQRFFQSGLTIGSVKG